MAEVIGVIGSVIAIASIAKPTAKLVKTLKDITKNDVSITGDILDMATHIELTSKTIGLALLRLKNHCKKIEVMENPDSRVARYIKRRNLKGTIRRTSNDVKRHLENAERHLSSMLGGLSFMNSLKWYIWNNKEVSAILTKMDRVALCLNVIGHNMELELTTYLYEEARGEVAKCMQIEIDSLRSQLEMTEKSLQQALESRGRETHNGSDLSTEFHDFGTLLLNLSESMRRTGSVPSDKDSRHPARSPSLRQPSEPVHRNPQICRHNNGRSEVLRSFQNIQSGQYLRTVVSRPSASSNSSQRRQPFPEPRALEIPTRSNSPSSRNTSTLQEASSETSQQTSSSRNSRSSRSPSSLSSPQMPETPQTPQSSLVPEAPKLASTQKTTLEKEQTSRSLRYIQGYLRSPTTTGMIHVKKAKIEPLWRDNFISVTTARKFNLDIESLGEHEPRHSIGYEGTGPPSEIMGKVVGAEWRKTTYSKPIRVDFWVKDYYHDEERDHVIFGRIFAKEL